MTTKRVIVYGGKGALGSSCVSAFKAQKWWVGNIAAGSNDAADANITVNYENTLVDQEKQILDQLQNVLKGDQVDAVVCVAGGWLGGNASSKDFTKNCDLTWKQSVVTSVIASSIAAKLMKKGGLLSLTGASGALEPTPGMIGYGMAKASVHHLTKSLAAPESGLPSDSTVVCVLPAILDTPMNRKWMPKADTTTWTPLSFIADLIIKWSENNERPPNGSLVKFSTQNSVTKIEIIS